jgi:hypothetical protein
MGGLRHYGAIASRMNLSAQRIMRGPCSAKVDRHDESIAVCNETIKR